MQKAPTEPREVTCHQAAGCELRRQALRGHGGSPLHPPSLEPQDGPCLSPTPTRHSPTLQAQGGRPCCSRAPRRSLSITHSQPQSPHLQNGPTVVPASAGCCLRATRSYFPTAPLARLHPAPPASALATPALSRAALPPLPHEGPFQICIRPPRLPCRALRGPASKDAEARQEQRPPAPPPCSPPAPQTALLVLERGAGPLGACAPAGLPARGSSRRVSTAVSSVRTGTRDLLPGYLRTGTATQHENGRASERANKPTE